MPMLTDHIQPRRVRVASFLPIVAALIVGLASTTSAQAQDPLKANHYLCYRVVESSGAQAPNVKLKDQFGDGATKPAKASYVCNPVDKNGEGIVNKESHLVCYTLRIGIKAKPVLIKNQFGELKIKLGSPEILCVPSTKKVM
jgi:hypothetical protein